LANSVVELSYIAPNVHPQATVAMSTWAIGCSTTLELASESTGKTSAATTKIFKRFPIYSCGIDRPLWATSGRSLFYQLGGCFRPKAAIRQEPIHLGLEVARARSGPSSDFGRVKPKIPRQHVQKGKHKNTESEPSCFAFLTQSSQIDERIRVYDHNKNQQRAAKRICGQDEKRAPGTCNTYEKIDQSQAEKYEGSPKAKSNGR
jgi:hypothetical protein